MIKFHHRRLLDPVYNTISGKGGATIAYEVMGNNIQYAVARCHTNDNFNKAQGRIKAAGRMNSNRYLHTYQGDRQSFLRMLEDTPLNMIGV